MWSHPTYPVSMSQRDLHDVVHAQILVVDDEAEHADTMAEALRRIGHVCTIVTSAADAEEELKYGNFDVVITDLSMEAEDSGMKVLKCTHEYQPDAEAIMVTAHGDIATAKAFWLWFWCGRQHHVVGDWSRVLMVACGASLPGRCWRFFQPCS